MNHDIDIELPYAKAKAEFERAYLEGVCKKFAGNVTRIAHHCGFTSVTFYRKVKELGITLPNRERK